jgi:transcriptional regulator with XRE-family HTH domain
MTTLDIVIMLCEKHNITLAQLERNIGVSHGSLAKMKTSTPKADRIQKIAEYFNVSTEYLITGKDTEKISDSGKKYYFSDETAELAQEAFTNKKTRILLDATRDLKPDDMQMVIDLAMRLKGTNTDG